MMKTILIMVLMAASLVTAVQPTMQTNKIFLSPFYTASMTQNVQYSFNVSTVVPDGISQIKSAIITLDAWINPTRTANITVNGLACNNPSYTISTSYASAGRGVFTFDCSNAMLPMRNNVVNITIIGGNIGSSTAWLDLTYMNNPVGDVKVHGTEYVGGDVGKLFLQFLDANNNAVNNSECFVSVWYPNDTIFLNNTLMSKLDNASEGIYYKNFNVPYVTGVYPASAKCYRPLTFYNTILYANISDNFDSGTWTGGVGWSVCPPGDLSCQNGWDVEDTVPLSTIVTNAGAGTGGCYNASAYCAKFTGSYGFIERGASPIPGTYAINISYYFKFSGWQNTEAAEFFIFDGNWHLLDRITLTNRSNNVWYNRSHYLTSQTYELDTFLIGWYADSPSTGDEFFVDAITIDVIAPNVTITNETEYQILRGSGEVHVNNASAFGSNTTFIADAVWNAANRNLTYYPAVNATLISDTVWNATNRNLTYYPDAITNATLVSDAVWNATNRNLTYYPDYTSRFDSIDNQLSNILNAIANVASDVWNYVGRYIHGEII